MKVWTVNEIRDNIKISDKWLTHTIIAIFNYQTASEQATENTHDLNKVGFSAFDAKRLTYYAKWLKSNRQLTGRHKEIARTKILKYSKQLTKIANKEI